MANTIDRKINPEIPIVQESNRNEVYVPNASYTEPGVAGFLKTHFIVDDNGIVHLRKAPERAVSGITYDSNTNTLIITFDDGTVQNIKLNDCACVDGVDLIVYDAFNVIEFDDGTLEKSSWTTLDAGKVLIIPAALTGYDNDEIIAQLDKYNVVTTNINDGSVTSNYQTDSEYQIYKCTDGSLVIFATEAFAGRFIILKREFAVQKNVANITYDDATGMLTIYYVTGDPVTLPIKFNLEPGTGEGAVQQIGANAFYNTSLEIAVLEESEKWVAGLEGFEYESFSIYDSYGYSDKNTVTRVAIVKYDISDTKKAAKALKGPVELNTVTNVDSDGYTGKRTYEYKYKYIYWCNCNWSKLK